MGKRITLSGMVLILSVTTLLYPTPSEADTIPFEWDEIWQIQLYSKLHYRFVVLDSAEADSIATKGRTLFTDLYREINDSGNVYLRHLKLSDSAELYFALEEGAYAAKDYDAALILATDLLKTQPGYCQALTLIGDAFYNLQVYDSAICYFEKAIKANFADYQAHWFLADALWKSGDTTRAIDEITTAHLINVNHKELQEKLVLYRWLSGRPWQNWDYRPLYQLSRKGDTVLIKYFSEWKEYALFKALFTHEPGYAELILGKEYEPDRQLDGLLLEERAAFAIWLKNEPNVDREYLDRIEEIIDSGNIACFLLYEVISHRIPEIMSVLPQDFIEAIKKYVERFH
jgi:tetratricopeptide (TPR) repeat protein